MALNHLFTYYHCYMHAHMYGPVHALQLSVYHQTLTPPTCFLQTSLYVPCEGSTRDPACASIGMLVDNGMRNNA